MNGIQNINCTNFCPISAVNHDHFYGYRYLYTQLKKPDRTMSSYDCAKLMAKEHIRKSNSGDARIMLYVQATAQMPFFIGERNCIRLARRHSQTLLVNYQAIAVPPPDIVPIPAGNPSLHTAFTTVVYMYALRMKVSMRRPL